jgi:hypothetical protein
MAQPTLLATSFLYHKINCKEWDEVSSFLKHPDIDIEIKRMAVLKTDVMWYENSFHRACTRKAPFDVVKTIIDIGGRELVLQTKYAKFNTLHFACDTDSSVDVVNLLMHVGGKELLAGTNSNGSLPLLLSAQKNLEPATALLQQGLHHQVGGEFGIGGLFLKDEHGQTAMEVMHSHHNWDDITASIGDMVQNTPFIHAAIGNVSEECLCEILSRFSYLLHTRDSMGRLPIEVAVQQNLKWENGMRCLLFAYAQKEQRSATHVAADHGVTWENGMSNLLLNSEEYYHVEHEDPGTGLYPFMLAASGEGSDLRTIYELLRISPGLA